jgi:hypothetical protein
MRYLAYVLVPRIPGTKISETSRAVCPTESDRLISIFSLENLKVVVVADVVELEAQHHSGP